MGGGVEGMLLLEAYDRFCGELQEHCRRLRELGLRQIKELPRVVLVSKGASVEQIAYLHDVRGVRCFAENRLGELQKKQEALAELELEWTYLGALQSKKIRHIGALCSEVQSLSSLHQWPLLERAVESPARKRRAKLRVFLQVNVSGQESRAGLGCEETLSFVEQYAQRPSFSHVLDLCGLMALPSLQDSQRCDAEDGEQIWRQRPRSYVRLEELHRACSQYMNLELSVGMSLDWKVAVAAGATTLRVGRRVFCAQQQFSQFSGH